MQKPEIKFEDGKLILKAGYAIDADQDQKAAAKIDLVVELDPAEIVSEIAKKDLGWLDALIAKIKG
jgi:hypothetical protein